MQKYERDIPDICKRFRAMLGKRLTDVADDTGYSVENISAFERGRNLNYRILLWYIDHGLNEEWCNKLHNMEGI